MSSVVTALPIPAHPQIRDLPYKTYFGGRITACTYYSLYLLQPALITACTYYSLYLLQPVLITACTYYSLYLLQPVLITACTYYSLYLLQPVLITACTYYSLYLLQPVLITACTYYSLYVSRTLTVDFFAKIDTLSLSQDQPLCMKMGTLDIDCAKICAYLRPRSDVAGNLLAPTLNLVITTNIYVYQFSDKMVGMKYRYRRNSRI